MMLGVQMHTEELGKRSDFIFLVRTPATHTRLAPKSKTKLFRSVSPFFISRSGRSVYLSMKHFQCFILAESQFKALLF